MRTPSVKNENAIRKIRQFHQKQKRVPTYEEMTKLFRFASKRSVFLLVERLVNAGLLEKDDRGRITLRHNSFSLPLLSTIPAGTPIDAEEQDIDRISLDEYLVGKPENCYLLKVTGDSMDEEGIRAGDLVVVDKKKEPKEGDIVAARVDEQVTLKFLRKENGHYCLVPANKNYKNIYPKDSLSVEGVITSVVRKYS